MAKMFYTAAEAATKLNKTTDQLKAMVREGKLREFMDNGAVYRTEDINKLAGVGAEPAGDAVDLELVEQEAGGGKEDTVITSAGISVFDDEDLQIEADPMAQTQITPSVEDQISLETTGSGSGLLDLTREADDTSLGAELLEEIYPTGPAAAGADSSPVMSDQSMPASEPAAGGFVPPVVMERPDPVASAMAGFALGGLLVAAFLAFMLAAVATGVWPGFLASLSEGSNPMIFGAVSLGVAVVFAVVGGLIGKTAKA